MYQNYVIFGQLQSEQKQFREVSVVGFIFYDDYLCNFFESVQVRDCVWTERSMWFTRTDRQNTFVAPVTSRIN